MRTLSLPFTQAFIIAMIVSVTTVAADPPKKPNLMKFSRLWTNSPFTIKPVVEPTKAESPLGRDWMLGSIRPGKNGYSVTLINKKDRKDRVRLIPGFTSGDWTLVNVVQDVKNSENSRVQVRKGSQMAWITYDEGLIKVRPAAASKTSSKRPESSSNNRNARPPIPGRNSSNSSKPRVRSVPRRGGR